MSEHTSAWSSLVEEWVERENRLHPESPIAADTVRVRDNVEIGDQMFVLVSYDVDYPWPSDEDTADNGRSANTAVLQAMRVRAPWIERDVTRAHTRLSADGGDTVVHEHVLGQRRAFSGHTQAAVERIELHFDDDTSEEVTVVGGWFLAVVPEEKRIVKLAGGTNDGSFEYTLARDESELVLPSSFARSADRTMYFSPLDLRSVVPVQHWERAGGVVVVATSAEQYDEGGVLRLRIDGVRVDDDALVTWPKVKLSVDGSPVASGVCGEYALADTLSLDIGFRPWIADPSSLTVTVEGLRGSEGPVGAIEFTVSLSKTR